MALKAEGKLGLSLSGPFRKAPHQGICHSVHYCILPFPVSTPHRKKQNRSDSTEKQRLRGTVTSFPCGMKGQGLFSFHWNFRWVSWHHLTGTTFLEGMKLFKYDKSGTPAINSGTLGSCFKPHLASAALFHVLLCSILCYLFLLEEEPGGITRKHSRKDRVRQSVTRRHLCKRKVKAETRYPPERRGQGRTVPKRGMEWEDEARRREIAICSSRIYPMAHSSSQN